MARNDAADALPFAFQRDRITWQTLWQGAWANPPLREPRFILGVDRAIEERPMTEAEWMATTDVAAMLEFLRTSVRGVTYDNPTIETGTPLASNRKLHLFGLACYRMEPIHPHGVEALTELERLADCEITASEWSEAASGFMGHESASRFAGAAVQWAVAVRGVASGRIAALLRSIVGSSFSPLVLPRSEKRCERCKGAGVWRVCPICGGRGTLPGDCPWLTETVRSLALAAYSETGAKCGRCKGEKTVPHFSGMYRIGSDPCPDCHGSGTLSGQLDPDTLAVLADAMEGEGCTDPAFILPLRGFRPCTYCPGTGELRFEGTWCPQCDRGWLRDETPRFRGWHVLDCLRGVE